MFKKNKSIYMDAFALRCDEDHLYQFKKFSMSHPKRRWTAPPQEAPAPTTRTRRITMWHEPFQEEEPPTTLRPFKIPQAKPKMRLTHSIQPQLHGPYNNGGTCSFPRFQKLRVQNPERSNEKVLQLQKTNADTWMAILAYLHRYFLFSEDSG